MDSLLLRVILGGALTAVMTVQADSDPTRPPAWASNESRPPVEFVAAEPLVLQQLQLGRQAVVVINNQLLSSGDRIQGYRVIRIDTEGVLLRSATDTQRLTLVNSALRSQPHQHKTTTARQHKTTTEGNQSQ